MMHIGSDRVAAVADYATLVHAIAKAFREGVTAPVRGHYSIPVPGGPEATLLTMPAWTEGAYLGVKIATVFPGNSRTGQRAVSGQYLLIDAMDGEPLALIDGGELTARRTAAASALAATFLARDDASTLTVIGTGRLPLHLVRAHRTMRPSIREVVIWGRHIDKAMRIAMDLRAENPDLVVTPTSDLETAVRRADLVSAATLSTEPVIQGRWLTPGVHVDLVGGFTPLMREADDDAIRRAHVFCDTLEGAPNEAGDLCQPIASGLLDPETLTSLTQLCRGERPGRQQAGDITLFKSVGCAAEDLAAAIVVFEAQKKVLNASTTS